MLHPPKFSWRSSPWAAAVHISPTCMGAMQGQRGIHSCAAELSLPCSWKKKSSRDFSLEWLRYIFLAWQNTRPRLRDVPTFVITMWCHYTATHFELKELLSCVNLCRWIILGHHSNHALPMFCWMQWQKLAGSIVQVDEIWFFHLPLGMAVVLQPMLCKKWWCFYIYFFFSNIRMF